MTNSNAAEFILAGKDPDREAVRVFEAAFSYGDLDAASSEFSSCLVEAGGAETERVVLLSGNSFHWVAAYLGILRAGMIAVPLPATISAEELRYVVENTGARFAFLQWKLRPFHNETFAAASVATFHETPSASSSHFQPGSKCRAKERSESLCDPAVAGLASLMYTSGSTGAPRGVMVSHANIVANTTSIIAALGLGADERMMTVLPFHYCFGTSLLHTYLKAGSTLVIDTRFSYPELVLEHMERADCSSFAGVPSHYQILLRNSSFTRRQFPALRSLLQAGGHLPPSFFKELQDALPWARIFAMYGQTEATARLACLAPELLMAKPGSIGKAIPGVTLRILNDAGQEVAPGEVGEIVAAGECITAGYWRAPEETARTFRNGKLHTGDLARVDEEGFLYVVDREKEFVKCAGIRVGCRQLEDRLLECEELLEAAVVGTPDQILGEAIRAFVVARPQRDPGIEERLRSFCKARLPHSLIPRDIVVLSELPKNSAGKVLRSQLKSTPVQAPAASSRETPSTGF